MNLQPRETREETQEGSHGTNGVAVRTAIAPGEHRQNDHRHDADDERRQGAQPDVFVIESVAVVVFRYSRQHVVACHPYGLQHVGGNESEGRVGGQQLKQRADARQQQDDEHHEHRIAQPPQLLGIRVAVFLLLLAQPSEYVLHDTQRTDDGAIDASADERQYQQESHDGKVQGQYSLHGLQLRHPRKPLERRSCKVHKQPRNADKHHGG